MVGHIRRTNIALVLAVMSGVRPGASAEPSRPASVVFNTVTAAVSERVEGRIVWPGRVFENPYDPACVSLDAVIEGPVGRRPAGTKPGSARPRGNTSAGQRRRAPAWDPE